MKNLFNQSDAAEVIKRIENFSFSGFDRLRYATFAFNEDQITVEFLFTEKQKKMHLTPMYCPKMQRSY